MTTVTTEAIAGVADLKAGYTLGHADVAILKTISAELLAVREAQSVPDSMRNKFKAAGVAELIKDAREYHPLTAAQWETLAKNWHQTFIGLSLSDDTVPPAVPDAVPTEEQLIAFAERHRLKLNNAWLLQIWEDAISLAAAPTPTK